MTAFLLLVVHIVFVAASSAEKPLRYDANVSVAAIQTGTGRRTVWDGVYTLEQAQRGQVIYKNACGYCHRDDLSGGGSEDGAPPLTGVSFAARWRDLSLAEMFVTVEKTMPRNAPGSLNAQAYADIISFVLKTNDMPAGESELPSGEATLDRIVFTGKPTDH